MAIYKHTSKQSGFTLVELLIAITLGLILTAAVIQSYLGMRKMNDINNGISRIQENARFSMLFLREPVRNAGYNSCIGRIRNKLNGDPAEFLSYANAVRGWEASGTQITDNFTLTGQIETSSTEWNDGSGGLPAYLNSQVIAGSDVISLKAYETIDADIASSDSSAGTITANGHGVENNDVMLVGNCWQAELFQHIGTSANDLTADQSSGTPGNRNLATNLWLRNYTSSDKLFKYTNTYFYIGEGAGGQPSLFRYKTSKPVSGITLANITADAQELVEGVESMQILYGEDTTNDLNPNRYISADQVTVWSNVVSVRLGLLFRSPNNSVDTDILPASYVLLDDIELAPANNDNILRYTVNSTIKLRNKGINQGFEPHACDAATTDCT